MIILAIVNIYIKVSLQRSEYLVPDSRNLSDFLSLQDPGKQDDKASRKRNRLKMQGTLAFN